MICTAERFDSKVIQGQGLNYVKYVPEKPVDGKLPLFIYIHGAGGRGDNLEIIKTAGAMDEFANGREVGAVCVAPQCFAHTWYDIYQLLLEFLENMICADEIDPDRVYIAGSSMGAYTVWQLLQSHPEWFAAAIPVCGGGMYWNASRMINIPIWATHGALDFTVNAEETIKMVRAINDFGGKAKITIYPQCDHCVWGPTFASDEIWEWLFAQKRQSNTNS